MVGLEHTHTVTHGAQPFHFHESLLKLRTSSCRVLLSLTGASRNEDDRCHDRVYA